MNEANTAWILVSTALVLLMTLPGLALFYAGLVSSKNTLSTLAQCFVIAVTLLLLMERDYFLEILIKCFYQE